MPCLLLLVTKVAKDLFNVHVLWYNILGSSLGWYYEAFSSQLKKTNKFSSHNIIISSKNNVPKYRIKGHEQV